MLLVFPFILGSNYENLTVEDREKINNNRGYYEVIEATTGKKEQSQYYAGDFEIKTHIETISALKKALADEGIDLSKVRIELYYDPIAIRDELPPRIWNFKPHRNTISSPWLDVTKTITTTGETRVTIRIDATAARLIDDLFSEPEHKDNTGGFLQISSITENCLSKAIAQYEEAIFKGGLNTDSLNCVDKQLREPLISLFKSAKPGASSLDEPTRFELEYYCQDAASKYYRELYPRLAVEGLKILEGDSKRNSKWWKEVVNTVKPIQECK